MAENRIRVKRSAVEGKAPSTADLDLGEIAINTHDGQMFIKRDRNGFESIIPMGSVDNTDRVYYVATTGDDSNTGESIGEAFASLDQAITVISAERDSYLQSNPGSVYRSTIYLKTGEYTISNPLELPPFTTIVGDNLRSVSIYPSTNGDDLFYVNNGCYLNGITFRGFTSPGAAVAFNPNPSSVPSITASPYVQNCSCITSTGTGMRIDGSVSGGTRSMIADGFTQYNEGGVGIHLLNRGYAQLVSIFTIACEKGIWAQSGGQCSLTNSNSSFGTFGLYSEGVSGVISSGSVSGSYIANNTEISITTTTPPTYGQAVLFSGSSRYYTVNDVTEVLDDLYTVTLLQPLEESISDTTAVDFYQRSLITASSMTFEYVGAGTDIPTALPENGGIPIQENEVIEDSDYGGQVYYTSTDQRGDFRIGNQLTINQDDGTITGLTFDRSIFNVLTPYILALED